MNAEVLNSKNWIAYLRADTQSIDTQDSQAFENGIHGTLDVYRTWIELITALNTRQLYLKSINSKDPIVVLIHIRSFLAKNQTTLSELTTMLATVNKCLSTKCSPILIGALVDKTCTTVVVKQIRDAGFDGLIPDHDVFGIDRTIEGTNTLLSARLYWPKDIVDALSGTQTKAPRRSGEFVLTVRQQEVMDLICSRGLSNKQIARILRISDSTVKIHVSAILKEYGLRSRTQLALAGTHDNVAC